MSGIILNFEEKVLEIEVYFDFLEKTLKNNASLVFPNNDIEQINNNLGKILKANSFILLYNLVESSIREAIAAIYAKMEYDVVSFDDLERSIKIEVIRNLKKNENATGFVDGINVITSDIISKCFSEKDLFQGNVDARKIKDLAKIYGFSSNTDNIITRGGSCLLKIKKNRNDLGHGFKTFNECGQIPIDEVIRIKKEAIEYLRQILNNIQTYINQKDYLH